MFVQFQLAAPLDYAAHGVGPADFSFLMAMNGLGVVVLQPLLDLRERERADTRASLTRIGSACLGGDAAKIVVTQNDRRTAPCPIGSRRRARQGNDIQNLNVMIR